MRRHCHDRCLFLAPFFLPLLQHLRLRSSFPDSLPLPPPVPHPLQILLPFLVSHHFKVSCAHTLTQCPLPPHQSLPPPQVQSRRRLCHHFQPQRPPQHCRQRDPRRPPQPTSEVAAAAAAAVVVQDRVLQHHTGCLCQDLNPPQCLQAACLSAWGFLIQESKATSASH